MARMGLPLNARSFRLLLLLLWLAAVALALTGLAGPPLRDWDEGIVARVALELSQQPWSDRLWPTYWGRAYLNKPPGLHWLVATAIDLWRSWSGAAPGALPPAWLLRSVPALLSTLLVPLLALLQLQLRPRDRLSALLTAAICLTLLLLSRHSHLLMLDGCQLVAMVGLWSAVLAAGGPPSQLLRQGLLAGLAASALLLLKAPVALPLLATTLLLRLLERDLHRRQWLPLILGVGIGLLPGLAWHGGHLLVRGQEALSMWLGQGFARVGSTVEGHDSGPITPLLQVLEGGWPWLPLWPFGIALAWRQRRTRAGFWCLGLTLLSAAMVLPLRTQLPWYSLLLWPPFALVCAPVLAWLLRGGQADRPPGAAVVAAIPRLWCLLGAALLLAGLIGLSQADGAAANGDSPALRTLAPALLAFGAGLLAGGLLLLRPDPRQRRRGLGLLLLGDWLALLLLFSSPLWLWELNESWPVGDGVVLLHSNGAGSDGSQVLLWRQGERPSLSWYAGRRIRSRKRIPLTSGDTLWLLGLESARPPGLECQTVERRGELQLQRCRSEP